MNAVLYSHTMFKRLTVVYFPQLLALCCQNNGFCRAELHVYKIENPFARFWNFLKLWLITFVSHNEALQGSLFLIKLLVRFLKIWLITFVSVSKTLQESLFCTQLLARFLVWVFATSQSINAWIRSIPDTIRDVDTKTGQTSGGGSQMQK